MKTESRFQHEGWVERSETPYEIAGGTEVPGFAALNPAYATEPLAHGIHACFAALREAC